MDDGLKCLNVKNVEDQLGIWNIIVTNVKKKKQVLNQKKQGVYVVDVEIIITIINMLIKIHSEEKVVWVIKLLR